MQHVTRIAYEETCVEQPISLVMFGVKRTQTSDMRESAAITPLKGTQLCEVSLLSDFVDVYLC